MNAILKFLPLIFIAVLVQNPPAGKPQDKRGLGLQPSPTPAETQSVKPSPASPTRPELVMQNGHTDLIRAVAFTPDGRLVITAGDDRTIKIWEVSTGRILRTLVGHTKPPRSLAISRDGRWLASAQMYVHIRIWDLIRGVEVRQLEQQEQIRSIAFTPDGFLASAGINKDYVWEITTGRVVSSVTRQRKIERLLKYKEKGVDKVADVSDYVLDFEVVALSPDGQRLAVRDKDNQIRIRDMSGREICKLAVVAKDPLETFTAAFSPDGKWFAIGETFAAFSVWNATTGERVFGTRIPEQVISFSFLPNGSALVVGTFVSSATLSKGRVRLFRLPAGEEIRRMEPANIPYRVTLTQDGGTLAIAGRESLELWNVEGGGSVAIMQGAHERVRDVTVSSDGRWLATAIIENTPRLWDLSSGQETGALPEIPAASQHLWGGGKEPFMPFPSEKPTPVKKDQTVSRSSFNLQRILFSPDARSLAASGGPFNGMFWQEDSVRIWDVNSRRQQTEFPTPRGHGALAISNDGRLLATTSDKTVRVWETATKREVLSWTTRRPYGPDKLAFSPDSRWLAACSYDPFLTVLDLSSGRESPAFPSSLGVPGHWSISDIAFSPDGKLLAVAGSSNRGIVTLIDPETGNRVRWIKAHDDISTSALAFPRQGDWFATAGTEGDIKLWETNTGRELRRLIGHSGAVDALAISPDGRWLASAGADNSTRIWDAATGEQLLTLISIPRTPHWAVISPDGLFDGSVEGINQLVAWRFGNETMPVEAFFNEFYYPGLLADVLDGKKPKAPRDLGQIDRRQPHVKLIHPDSPTTSGAVPARTVKLTVDVAEAPANEQRRVGSGARDLRLFRNGLLVKVWRGDVLKGKSSVTLEATVPVIAGENRFTAYAFNRDNIKSSDATLMVKGAESLKRKGIAYILSVGVNEYANSGYNLNYAVADAQAFAEEMKRQQAKLNQHERVEIISLNDKAATKGAILKSLADLSGKTQPEDAVIIYFAGHGTAHGNRFYLIPHDLGYGGARTKLDSAGLQNILAHSVSDEELEQAVEGIDAGQLLMVIDACNSGQALEAEEKRRGPMNSKGLAQLAYEKGMYILTAAQSYQAALEAARLGHGYLTYALVEEGLKTNVSDRAPKDGQVLVREWLDFATARVPEMQQEKIVEQLRQGRELELLIKFVESDKGKERNVQRPRVFYRREAEASPLIVAKP
jgi:WD40 repeat protein